MENKEYQLIEKCKLGDSKSKEWIYRKYAPILLGVCMRYIKDRMQAEDVLHEGFITVFEKIDQFEHKGSFEGWLKRIIVNKTLNYLKGQANFVEIDRVNEPAESETENTEPTNVKDIVTQADFSKDEMLEVIKNLPDGFRTVFNLYVFENYQHKEIAETLNISVGTSKSQLLRARKFIQKKLYEKTLEKKSKKKNGLITYSVLLFMNDELNYIDKIAKSKLEGFTIDPVSSFSGTEFSNTGMPDASVSNSLIGNAKSQLITVAGNKIVWISSAILGTSAVTYLGINAHSSKVIPEIEPVVEIIDSSITEPVNDELDFMVEETKLKEETIVKAKKEIIRKPVKIKKEVVVTKQIPIKKEVKITDTLPKPKNK